MKGSNPASRGPRTEISGQNWRSVKKVPNGRFQGPSQEKSTYGIFRFGYGQAANHKKVSDPVGSEVFVIQSWSSATASDKTLRWSNHPPPFCPPGAEISVVF